MAQNQRRITRRDFLKAGITAAPIVGFGLRASAALKGRIATNDQPKNVLIFITDQQRATQHFPAGWEEQNLPGLTRLKKNGLSFERAFTNACMCSPARSTSDNYLVQILNILEQQNLINNTVIISTSDHGEMGLTHNGQRQKNFNFYEESIRVPLVYSNPLLYPTARQSNALVSHVDFLPTIASLFNAPSQARANWQGVDYSSVLLNPSAPAVQDYTVFTYDDYQSGQKNGPYPFPPNHIVSIREERYKLAEYYDADGHVDSQWEMYDLLNDPLETTNIAWPTYNRSPEQQMQYDRLKLKLQHVKSSRLQPLS